MALDLYVKAAAGSAGRVRTQGAAVAKGVGRGGSISGQRAKRRLAVAGGEGGEGIA